MMESTYQILVADDHTLFREGIIRILKRIDGVKTVGEASNGKELIEKLKTQNWDLVLLDLEMPIMNGIQTLEKLEVTPHTPPVIVVSMHRQINYVKRVFDLGAKGYILKDADSEELKLAINTVLNGNNYYTPVISSMLLDNIKQKQLGPKLSKQETRVLQLICEEKTSKEISDILFLGFKTVESYRKSLMSKTGAINMAGLTIFAIENGYYVLRKNYLQNF